MPTIAAPRALASRMERDDRRAARRVESSCWLVEQEDGIVHHETSRDVDTLLLAPRKGCGRDMPEPLGDAEPREEVARGGVCFRSGTAGDASGLGNNVDCRDTWYHPQKLAHIANGAMTHRNHLPGFGGDQVDSAVLMDHKNLAAIWLVVGVQRTKQCRLAGTRATMQADALAGLHGQVEASKDWNADAPWL